MAFAAATEWDVRTAGSDANGGGFNTASSGTDRSQANTPFQVYTDLVIVGVNTALTSAAHPFAASDVGNVINVTGGTGFTVQRLQIVSVAGVTATVDKPAGTVGSTGGAGNLGGALATVGAAVAVAVVDNTVWVKAGTYAVTAPIAIGIVSLTIEGYSTTHGDKGPRPLITTSTNSLNLITSTGGGTGTLRFINLSLSHTAGTRGNGIVQLSVFGNGLYWVFSLCLLDGFSTGINSDNVGSNFTISGTIVDKCEIKNCTGNGITPNTTGGSTTTVNCSWIHNNGGDGINSVSNVQAYYSVFSANGASGIAISSSAQAEILSCCFVGNTAKGFWGAASAAFHVIANSIFWGNAAAANIFITGRTTGMSNRDSTASHNNAYPAGGTTGWAASQGDVTLTGSPFVSTTNFALNATAGAGAACAAAGFPGVAAFGTGMLNIGSVQTGGTGGGQKGYPV